MNNSKRTHTLKYLLFASAAFLMSFSALSKDHKIILIHGLQVSQITNTQLDIAGQGITPGESSIRKLSVMKTLVSRAVCCDADQSEADFLSAVARDLKQMDIEVSKMICGKSGEISAGNHWRRLYNFICGLTPVIKSGFMAFVWRNRVMAGSGPNRVAPACPCQEERSW